MIRPVMTTINIEKISEKSQSKEDSSMVEESIVSEKSLPSITPQSSDIIQKMLQMKEGKIHRPIDKQSTRQIFDEESSDSPQAIRKQGSFIVKDENISFSPEERGKISKLNSLKPHHTSMKLQTLLKPI